ncbi:MAG: peroxiredoxin [Mycoplasmoidaceae bacterium]
MIVTKKAIDFTAEAIMPDNSIKSDFNLYNAIEKSKKGIILFFWPKDFTFVCPSEIIAFNNKLADFKSRGFDLVGISIDSEFVHLAWKKVPVEKGGIGNIQFPLISDITKQIARDYDILLDEKIALRATFIISKNKIIRHSTINDLPIGRNVEETLRTVDAIIHTDEFGDVCPANWKNKMATMKPNPDGVAAYLSKNSGDLK